ncbi:peptidoglycan recognition protein [Peterkaempfera sp. SMS 1(5)a]|uniref:peptidoglycan recognition protein family protein n=1 Tax=Peterkaempfera podocarpi TaxID=3232308 RepID=UPI00366B3D18
MRVLRSAPSAAAGAAVLGLVALAACAAPPAVPVRSGAAARKEAPGAPRPASSYTLPLVTRTPAGTTAPRAVPAHTTRPFSMLGVVWDDARNPLNATVRIRTRDRTDGRWSAWQTLRAEDREQPGPSADKEQARGYTSPLWVGPSNGVQVVVGPPSGGILPTGLRLALVDPGGPAEQPAVPGGPPHWLLLHDSAARPASPVRYTVPRPAMVGRAGWKADESLRHKAPIYAPGVRMIFIHHTDNPNGYSCSEVPEMIRAMYQYHVTELAWDDIGYNFLVDRCGTIYEGRAGGVDRPVVGGHTMGFNIGSMGIAAIGDFRAGNTVPKPMIDAIARLAAWKLSLAGVSPTGHAVMVSQDSATRYRKGTKVVLNVISGHRDAVYTECPGDSLYAVLPIIRAKAAGLVRDAAAHHAAKH